MEDIDARPEAHELFWDLVEGRARLAALDEIEGAFGTAGHGSEVMDRVKRRRAQVNRSLEKLVEEAKQHHSPA